MLSHKKSSSRAVYKFMQSGWVNRISKYIKWLVLQEKQNICDKRPYLITCKTIVHANSPVKFSYSWTSAVKNTYGIGLCVTITLTQSTFYFLIHPYSTLLWTYFMLWCSKMYSSAFNSAVSTHILKKSFPDKRQAL